MLDLRRRQFITLLGGAATGWPLAARAQQPTPPTVGFLYSGDPSADADLAAMFRNGLREAGYIEGQNVAIEYRWARHDNSKLPGMIDDLVRRRVAVIAATGNPATRVAAATRTIPIVFTIGFDPVRAGIVASLARPGANITGITTLNGLIGTKWLGLLHELLPTAERFAMLVNPNNRNAEALTRDAQATASAIGRQIEIFNASSTREIDAAFVNLLQKRADALLVSPDPLFDSRRVQLVTLATHHRLPTIYSFRENVEIGGLMSYGSSAADRDRQVGIYTGRILKGEKAAELPVIRAAKFEFVINLQTAKVLGLNVPQALLATADEVIE